MIHQSYSNLLLKSLHPKINLAEALNQEPCLSPLSTFVAISCKSCQAHRFLLVTSITYNKRTKVEYYSMTLCFFTTSQKYVCCSTFFLLLLSMCYTYKFDHVFSITMNTYRSMKSITRANQNIGADDDDQFIHDDILEACQTTTQEQNAVKQGQEAGSPRQSART